MRETQPAPEGADQTAAHEIEPSAAAHKRSWASPKIAYANDIAPTRGSSTVHQSRPNEPGWSTLSVVDGVRVIVNVVGRPDGGARRRWLQQLLFGSDRLDGVDDQPDCRIFVRARAPPGRETVRRYTVYKYSVANSSKNVNT